MISKVSGNRRKRGWIRSRQLFWKRADVLMSGFIVSIATARSHSFPRTVDIGSIRIWWVLHLEWPNCLGRSNAGVVGTADGFVGIFCIQSDGFDCRQARSNDRLHPFSDVAVTWRLKIRRSSTDVRESEDCQPALNSVCRDQIDFIDVGAQFAGDQ